MTYFDSLGLAPAALLPDFLDPGLLVTVQPAGVVFSRPVPITFPNVDDLPAGSEVDIWSLDPESGEFSIVGTGRVTNNGQSIETISGGIIRADWHAPAPAPPDDPPEPPHDDPDNPCNCPKQPSGSTVSLNDGPATHRHTCW